MYKYELNIMCGNWLRAYLACWCVVRKYIHFFHTSEKNILVCMARNYFMKHFVEEETTRRDLLTPLVFVNFVNVRFSSECLSSEMLALIILRNIFTTC